MIDLDAHRDPETNTLNPWVVIQAIDEIEERPWDIEHQKEIQDRISGIYLLIGRQMCKRRLHIGAKEETDPLPAGTSTRISACIAALQQQVMERMEY